MRKFHLLGIALFAMLAFGAFVASEAVALETVWLEGGAKPLEELLVDSEGELLLVDLGALLEPDFLCSFLNEGIIGGHLVNEVLELGARWDEVTKVTGLEPVAEPLWILCIFTKQGSCESAAASSPEVMPVNLPWLTELTLDAGGVFLDLLFGTGGNAGWTARCLVLGVNTEDTCTAAKAMVEIDNTTEGDVKALFSDVISPELATCGLGGAESGEVEGEMLVLTASGESLAVSEA